MNMKFLQVFAVSMLAGPWIGLADTSITSPYGFVYRFGEWSAPSTISVDSAAGPVQLVSKTCDVTIEGGRWTEHKNLQFLFHPDLHEVWLGEPVERYVVVGQKIWAPTLKGTHLMIRTSESAGDAPDGYEQIIEQFLTKYLDHASTLYWMDGSVTIVPVLDVFGFEAPGDFDSTPSAKPSLQLLNIGVAPNSVTINLIALRTGTPLDVRLNEKMEVVEAHKKGMPWPVIRSTFKLSRDLDRWFSPLITRLQSPTGIVSALRLRREYMAADDSGALTRLLGAAKALLLVASGDLWIGPDLCRFAVVDGQIFGVMVDNQAAEIQVFRGQRARLPIAQGTAPVLEAELRLFDQNFLKSEYRIQPDFSMSLPGRFAGDDFNLVSVSTRESALVLTLTSGTAEYPEVTLSSDLKTISSRVLSREEASIVFQKARASRASGLEF